MKFFALIIFISLFPYLNCTSSENGKNKETKQSKSIKLKKYSPKDLPFIGCSVCEKVSKELYSQVTKLTYFDKQVERTIDNICKEYDVDHYTWIHKYDIREKKIQVNGKEKRQLYLEEPGRYVLFMYTVIHIVNNSSICNHIILIIYIIND